MSWPNGEIPESELVIFKRGHNSRDGDFYWGLPPATYLKNLALVARALKRTGRTLSPSDGWSTYRPLAAQVAARKRYGNGAAKPGTSSHGGFWEKHDTAAIDYGNWEWVYAKFGARAREEFYADCRAVGLTPGMISKARGYPDETWHVIDLDPWAPVPSGAITAPPTSITPDLSEEDDMAVLVTGGGQNLIVGGKLIPLNGPAEVQAVKGAQVLEVAPSTHYNIIQAFAREGVNEALPVLVYVNGGNGTVYMLQDGKLEALVDPTTLSALHAQGAAAVTLSQAEVSNLLKAS